MANDRNNTLGRLISTIVREQGMSVGRLAEILGLEYGTTKARLDGRVRFRIEEVVQLIRHFGDERLCDYLLRDSDFVASRRVPASETVNPAEARSSALRIAATCAATMASIMHTIARGEMTPARYQEFLSSMYEAEREFAAVRACVPLLVPQKGSLGVQPAAVHHRDRPQRTVFPTEIFVAPPSDNVDAIRT